MTRLPATIGTASAWGTSGTAAGAAHSMTRLPATIGTAAGVARLDHQLAGENEREGVGSKLFERAPGTARQQKQVRGQN